MQVILEDSMTRVVLCLMVLSLLRSGKLALCQDANPPIYSEIIPTSSGLAYNAATDVRESFTAPNGKTVEVLVKGPVGSGTYSRAIKSDETPDEYFPAVVAEAVKANAHHLVIPKGVYTFHGPKLCTDLSSPACNLPSSCNVNQYWNCQPHWTIGQYPSGQVTKPDFVSDLDIDFSGSELDFSAPVIGIWILEAQRLRLRNFTVDWPGLPIASLGTIVRDPDNRGHNALVLDQKYPVKDAYQGGPVEIQAVDIWDESKANPPGVFDPKSNNYFETYFIFGNAPQPTYVGKTAAGEQTFSCKSCHFQNSTSDPTCSMFSGCANFDLFAHGTRVIVRHYTYNGTAIFVNWSNDIDFENVKLRTGPGVGFSLSNNGGYRGFRIANSEITRGPGRLISVAASAINVATQADFILEGNNVGYQGDDSIDIYSATAPIAGVKGKDIQIAGICDPDPMDSPITGDALAFFDTNYLYKGTARVVGSGGSVCGTLSLTLDHAIAGIDTSSSLLDLTQQPSARYFVRDNVLHECRCHGVLVNAPYGLIDHNVMYGNSAGAIQLAGGNSQGPGATNLAITNNAMSDSGQWAQFYGAVSLVAAAADGSIVASPVFQKIKMQNNSIENVPGPAMMVTSTRDFSIDLNWISNANQVQASPTDYGSVSTLDSILLYRSSDGTVCDPYKSGPTTGPIGIDPSDSSISVESNCALYGNR
jgi:hypothetical protein